MKRSNHRRTRQQNNRRNLHIEPLEQRLCLAASLGWDGPGLGAASLSYYISNVPAGVGLEQTQVETAIKSALNAWAQVADLTFTQTTLARQSDSLDITFTSIDGSGGILAQAYLPDDVNQGRLAGDIEFDLADPWEVGNGSGPRAFDFVLVAVHEIGHALGLDHLNIVGSVMRPSVSPSQVFTTLSTADRNLILGQYATAASDPADAGNTDSDGGTVAADQGGDTTSDEQPRRRGGGWPGHFGGFGGWRGRSGRATAGTLTAALSHHNSASPTDVNTDGFVTALDALTIINDLNKNGPRSLSLGEGEAGSSFSMVDVNGDESITALDVLRVINELNNSTPVSIAIEEPIDQETTTEEDEESEEEPGSELDDETMVDDGPLEEEQGRCHGGRRDPFGRFDANEDGLLTVDEVPEMLWDRLLAADADEDGAITAAELEAIALEHHRGEPFKRFDTNEDGALTIDEVPERLWERISQADADEDGTVTTDEFADRFARRRPRRGDHHDHHRR